MRRNYDPETLSKYKYPNLVAEFLESGYHICTLSEHMGLGRRKENDPLMREKLFGSDEITCDEAVGLSKLFSCKVEYLFSDTLEKLGDMHVAYIRHYESNKRMERDMELYELSEKVRKALKEKPYLPELIKYVLELDEQQIEQMIEISKNVKAA